jgi:glycosyltransferase involved in cell wall biosynthesis
VRILVVSPTPSHPANAGNRARILNLLQALRAMGHDIHLLHVEIEPGDANAMQSHWGAGYSALTYQKPDRPETGAQRWLRRLRQLLDRDRRWLNRIDDWYPESLDAQVDALHARHRFDAVLVEYVFLSRVLERFGPGTLKLIDTHDRLAFRHRIYLANGVTPAWFSTTEAEEGRGLDRADVVIAIQDGERRYFETVSRRPTITVGHLADVLPPDPGHARRSDRLLFVGSGNAANVAGIRFMLDQVLPALQTQRPGLRLQLAGRIGESFADDPRCDKLGQVDDLRAVYADAGAVVNPVLQGTGLNIKSIEALAHGAPMVTTEAGSRGLEAGIDRAFLLGRDAQGLRTAILRVLDDRALAASLSAAALDLAHDHNRASLAELRSVLDGFSARRSAGPAHGVALHGERPDRSQD